MKILIIEDEIEIGRLIEQLLEAEGFTCLTCRDGLNALTIVQNEQPDLIILDLMLPGLDGLEICARIRQKAGLKDPYILMLTARGEEIDRVIGLSTGADDYMVKPFSPRELVARVRALLRRSLRHTSHSQTYKSVHFSLDLDRHLAFRFNYLRI
jgi:DNA-binding response OmpR family regulator